QGLLVILIILVIAIKPVLQLCRGGTVTAMVVSAILGATVIGGRLLRMIAITLGSVSCAIMAALLTGATATRITDTQCAALGIRLIHLTIWQFGYLKVFDAGAKFSAELVGKLVYGVWGRAPSKFFFRKVGFVGF
ncbi:MAG: hypothetical protein M0Q45_03765, partial [Bacteroidales bacterium]|nr:hypothetical protein [Bacteroidales bacterium]